MAVYEESRPHLLNVMYDARTGDAWPCDDGRGGDAHARAAVVGRRLVGRVRGLTGDGGYWFGHFNDPDPPGGE